VEDPGQPIQNVSSRFGGTTIRGVQAAGFNNIELITDRPLETNFREIYETKKKYPKHAVIVSLMVETARSGRTSSSARSTPAPMASSSTSAARTACASAAWARRSGRSRSVNQEITSWAVEYSTIPVLVKLTPNVADIVPHGLAAKRGGAHGVSLINTIKSIISVDIDRFVLEPRVSGLSTNGGYCGAAVKPIALHMVAAAGPLEGLRPAHQRHRRHVQLARRRRVHPARVESVQVCTEVMLRGLSRRRGHDRGPRGVHAQPRLRHLDADGRQGGPLVQRVGRPRPQLRDGREDRPRRSASAASCA
jgi:dihydropyrimidine dehydrogenase (NAD+) subunit PreA